MGRERIQFFSEDTSFLLKHKALVRRWVRESIRAENRRPGDLNFIFCSDEYLLKINREYLDHDTYTDIVTFDTGETAGQLSGDIFISIDRVRENALKHNASEEDELTRVLIHGLLHLAGFKDKTDADRANMRAKEEHYIRSRRMMPA